MSENWKKELAQISAAIHRSLKADKEHNVTISLSVNSVGPELGIEKEVNVAETFGWLLRQLPGHRYRKLLMRMIIAQREYTRIDKHLNQLWRAT